MKWQARIAGLILLAVCLLPAAAPAHAQSCPPLSDDQELDLLAQHLVGGAPSSDGTILVRRPYVTEYDAAHRVPRWTAWEVAADYLKTPQRRGQWAQFRTDPSVADPVRTADYTGVGPLDMARGHIAPYFISGGDRDHDGLYAADDLDDACAVFEINYMSNVAPQFQSSFNGSGGLWYKLETEIRRNLIGPDMAIHVIAGTVFGDADIKTIGPNKDIAVPHMFFQILITDSGVVPFLFIHTAQIGPNGCALDAVLEACIVTIGDIEEITGLDFFAGLDDETELLLESGDGVAAWHALLGQ